MAGLGAKPKFNFVPEKQVGEEQAGNGYWTVSLLATKQTPQIYVPSDMVRALDMSGKYFQLFADIEKRAIGWREVVGKVDSEDLKGARQLNSNKESGAILISVGRLLKAMKYELKETAKHIKVETYTSPLLSGQFSYVILPEIAYQEKKNSDAK